MAYSQTDLDTIRSAIAKGELRVTFADRSVEYRSIDDLLKAESHIANALSAGTRSKQSFGTASKGFQ
jgi:hypothetical protein